MDSDDDTSDETSQSQTAGDKETIANDTFLKSGKTLRNTVDVYVAEGVYTDCENILKEFMLLQTSTFEDFAKIWKEKKFEEIYTGKDTFSELLEFSEEALAIAKSFILPPHSQIKRIGGLYLMYGLFTQQPFGPVVKFRVTPQEWSVILKFVENLKAHGFIDANYIFHKMSYKGAFLTVANTREYALERSYRKYLMAWPARDEEHRPEVNYSLETLMGRVYRGGLRIAAQTCRSKYNKLKVLLEAKDSKFRSVQGTEVDLDIVLQENVDGSLNTVDSLEVNEGTKKIISVGKGRQLIKDKAFAMPAQQQRAQCSQNKDPVEETVSKSHCDTQTNSDSNLINLEESDSDSEEDSEFKYIVKPPSKRNSRKLKKLKMEKLAKSDNQQSTKKIAKYQPSRKFSFVEVTGVKPTYKGLHSKAVPKMRAGRKKGSKNNPVTIDPDEVPEDEPHIIVDVPVKTITKTTSIKSSQSRKSLPAVKESPLSPSPVRRSLRTPKRKKRFPSP